MELDEFRKYISSIKAIWLMKKNPVNKDDLRVYKDMKRIFEKSIVINRDLLKNHKIQIDDLSFKKTQTESLPNTIKKF